MARKLIRAAWVLLSIEVFAAGCIVPRPAAGQPPDEPGATAAVEFPTVWANGEPISAESLRGKGVFLYFFEENCPRCRDRWPLLMDKAAKYAADPIVFVAVNSGTSKHELEQYARGVNLTWPILVDQDRSFERRADVGEISLQNVMQAAYLSAGGELRRGDWSDIDGTIRAALAGAKWNVDPDRIPAELLPAWRSVEFCQYAEARPALVKGLASRKEDVKAAAEKLSDFVESRSARDLAVAEASLSEGHKLRAYQRYGVIAEKFAGYSAAEQAAAARRELAKDPGLKKEIVSLKQFEKQRELVYSPKQAVREKARAAIQKLIDAEPASEAARLGRELLHKK